MSKSGKITGGVASSERRAARKAFWLFLAVAILCTAQVGWWLIIHMRDAQALAELKQAELRSEAYLLDEMLRSHYIGLWYTLDSAIHRDLLLYSGPHRATAGRNSYNVNRVEHNALEMPNQITA